MSTTHEEKERQLSAVGRMRKHVMSAEKAKKTAGRMKLLSHPTRLQILKILSEKDQCVCALAELTGRSQPNISQHLAKLKDNNVIEDYHVGKLVFYRIKDRQMLRLINSV